MSGLGILVALFLWVVAWLSTVPWITKGTSTNRLIEACKALWLFSWPAFVVFLLALGFTRSLIKDLGVAKPSFLLVSPAVAAAGAVTLLFLVVATTGYTVLGDRVRRERECSQEEGHQRPSSPNPESVWSRS